MSKSRQAAKSAFIIVVFTLVSKFLGFLREILIAAKFGSGMETDTFFVALTATGIVTGFLSNAVSTTFIPILSEIESKEGKKGKLEHTNNILNSMFFISLILVFISWVGAPVIIRLLAKGFEGEQFNLAVRLTRIGLPMILFSGIIGTFTGYLQSEERFLSSSAIGVPFNFVYIFFLIFFSDKFGIKGLMAAAVLAVISQYIIQIPEAKAAGYKYEFKFNIRDKYIKKVIVLSLPVLVSVVINDIGAIIDRTLASDLSTGSISALNYANKLNGFILGVFISAITTVIFPILSRASSENNISGLKKVMRYGVNFILMITVPAAVGLAVLAKPIVEVAFERGVFDSTATVMTSQALMAYSIGLVGMALQLLLNRVYYSLQDTKTPMLIGGIAVGIDIVLNIILVKFMAHIGLALSTSIGAIAASVMLLYGVKKKIGSLGIKGYIVTFTKTGLASAVMGAAVYLIYHGLYGMLEVSKLYNLISLLAAVGSGVIIYGILCYAFKVEEVRDMVTRIRKTNILHRNKA